MKNLNKTKLTFWFAVCLGLLLFVSAVGYDVIYSDANNAGIFNQTSVTASIGISLSKNTTEYIFTSGDFNSFVFYNSTASNKYWNITLGISTRNLTEAITGDANKNITLQTRTANSYNITDIGLVALWGLNNDTGENATYFKDETGRNNGTCATTTCPTLTLNGTVGNAQSFNGSTFINVTGNFRTPLEFVKYNNALPADSNNISKILGTISQGTSGTGDSNWVYSPSVIKEDDGTFKMWYIGSKNIDGALNSTIFLATSPDGYNWTKYNNTYSLPSDTTSFYGQVPLGTSGKGDDSGIHALSVLKDNGNYKMWYTGYESSTVGKVYYATSPDGYNWTKYNNTSPTANNTQSFYGQVPLGTSGRGDVTSIGGNSVIKEDDGTYRMWYNSDSLRILYATSPDGINWTKYNNTIPSRSNNFSIQGKIPLGTSGTSDDAGIYALFVLKDNGNYKMWYSGDSGSGIYLNYYATSPDGINWTKIDNTYPVSVDSSPPVSGNNGRIALGSSGKIDDAATYSGSVLKSNGTYMMWYTGYDGTGTGGYYTAMATAPEASTAFWRNKNGVWEHVVNSAGYIYINGADPTELTSLGANYPLLTSNYSLLIGIGANDTRYWKGTIDDVRFYNRSLNATEVYNLYQLGSYHISDWGAWSSTSVVNDGIAQTTSSFGKFMQFKANFFTNTTQVSPYLLNHSGLAFNSAPSVSSIILNSTNVLSNETSQNLRCYANITDANGDNIYANFTWYNNSVEVIQLRGQVGPYASGTLNLVSTVNSGNMSWNQNWSCSVRGYDGTDYGSFVNSGNLTILDLINPTATLNTPANNSYVNTVGQDNLSLIVASQLNYSASVFGMFNQTNLTESLGLSILKNTTGYNFSSGDYLSFVAYNPTAYYWNISLSIADSYSQRSGVVNNFGINLSEPSLVSYWSLDNTNGTFFADATGKNNGTCDYANSYCPINASGLSSPAMSFDNTNDYINTTNHADNLENMSVGAWIKTADTEGYIITKASTVSGASPGWAFYLSAGDFYFYAIQDAANYRGKYYATSLQDNLWHHLFMAKNGTTIRLYVDGVEKTGAYSTLGTVTSYSNTLAVTIGELAGSTTNTFNGAIDEVLIYNKSLNATDISAIYKSGLSQHANTNITLQTRTATSYNTSDVGLVALWGLNTDTGENATFFKDETGRNNGTCISASSYCPIFYSNGTVRSAYRFDGSDDFINISTSGMSASNGTVSLWYNPWALGTSAINRYIFSHSTDGTTNNNRIYIYHSGTASDPSLNIRLGSSAAVDTGANFGGYYWHYLSLTWDNGNYKAYLNGVNVNSGTYSGLSSINPYAMFGGFHQGGSTVYASIDEVRIYNRSLSASEIQNLYQLGSYHLNWDNGGAWSSAVPVSDNAGIGTASEGKFVQFKANFYTNDTLVSPYILNHAITSLLLPLGTNVVNKNLTATIADTGSGIKNATVYVYNQSGFFDSGTITYASGTLTATIGIVLSFIDGVYNWFYQIFDFVGNSYTTGNYTLTVDTTNPAVNFTNPTPANGSSSLGSVFVNTSITELHLTNITVNWNGTLFSMNNLDNPGDLTDGLVLMMNMNNESLYGENASRNYDFSGRGNNGSCSGARCPAWNSAGKYNGAMDFNGSTFINVTGNFRTPLEFVKYDSWPVPGKQNNVSLALGMLSNGGTGSGDDLGVLYPSVVREDDGTYKMWYLGGDGVNTTIFLATSPDGINWTKYNNTNPSPSDNTSFYGQIPLGTSGKGDDVAIDSFAIIKDEGVYKAWYGGVESASVYKIYYATSPDGINWTKYNNTSPTENNTQSFYGQIPDGTTGRGDATLVTGGTVIKDDGTYKMWYIGNSGTNRIYYATSPDGINWTKYNNTLPPTSNNFSIQGKIPLGKTGSGDTGNFYRPFVIKDNGVYKMWYGSITTTIRIYYAISPDGINWTKVDNSISASTYTDDEPPVSAGNGRIFIGSNGAIDDNYIYSVFVLKNNGEYTMWYDGHDSSNYRILMATAPEASTAFWRNKNGVWEYVVNSAGYIYINGEHPTAFTSLGADYPLLTSNYSLLIGIGANDTRYWNGSIEEVMVWNRSLSSAEVEMLYNNQLRNYPDTNSAYLMNSSSNASLTLSLDKTANTNYALNFTFTGMSSSIYFYNVSAIDIVGNTNKTETRFISGNAPPAITIVYPLNGDNYSSANAPSMQLNYTVLDSDGNLESCWYYNGTGNTIITCGDNVTGLTTTLHNNTWIVYANDTSNSLGSGSVTFFSNTLPNITSVILNSTNPASNETNQNLTCYALASDNENDNIYYNYSWYKNGALNLTGMSASFAQNTLALVSVLTSGNLSWNENWSCNVSAYDSYNFSSWMNSSSVLVLDITNPTANLNTPANASYNATLTINLTAIITDESSGIQNISLYINGVYNQTVTYAAGTLTTTIGIVLTFIDGVYNWFYQIFDWAGNSYTTGNYTLIVDTTYPIVNFTALNPANYSARTDNFTAYLNITEVNLANVTFNFNGSISVYNLIDNSSYFGGASPNYTFSINQTGLVAGNIYFYNLSVIDLAGNSNNTETRLIRGNTAPAFNSAVNSPDINATLDPGVVITITANISDIDYNLEGAVLKWRNSTADWSDANSTKMLNQTPIYSINNMLSPSTIFNISFTTYSYEHNLSYMLVSNDSLGVLTNSSITNLSVLWDCNWNVTSGGPIYNSFGSVSGFDSVHKYIGNITLINWGDAQYSENGCNISFRLSHTITPQSRVCLEGQCWSSSNAITVPAGTNYTAIINATFYAPTTPTSETISILVSNTNINTAASNLNVSATLVTSQAGPYLTEEITSYPASVYLTSGNISLNAYVQNVMGSSVPNATNTAFNVSFNWTSSSIAEFTNISGNLTRVYDNISDNNYNYNNVVLNFADLTAMTPGTRTFTASAYGVNETAGTITDANNRTVFNSSASVTFLCYNISDTICVTACGHAQDPDCAETGGTTTITTITTTSGGGGGVTGGGAATKSEATFELKRGEASVFELEFRNKYPGKMKNIKISVSGINAEYILINPDKIPLMLGYSSQKIKVKINAPAYFTGKKYILNFLIEGTLDANGIDTPVSERKVVTLYITEVASGDANNYILEIGNFINEMNNSGLNIKEISKLLESMGKDYKEYSFNNVQDYYELAKKIYDNAIESKSIIAELETAVEDAEKRGISVLETKKMLYIAEAAFDRGDYSLALERLKEAKLTFALETKGEFNLAYEIKNNPIQSLAILFGLGLVGVGSSLLIRYQLYKKKLRALKEEQMLLLELMKIVQKECFERSHMSMEEYENAMMQYEMKLSETIEQIIKTETGLANMLKIKGKKIALAEEKKKLIEMMQSIQNDYLVKGKLETRIYEGMMKSYIKRLTEVQEETATIEAEEAVRRERKVKGMFRVKK